MGPFKKKGKFVGYSDQSKVYRVYILGYRLIEISRNVIFDEDATFNMSRNNHADEDQEEEHEAPKVKGSYQIPVRTIEEE